VSFALDKLTADGALYSAAERFMVLVIVRAMKEDKGEFSCFLSLPTIARRSGVSVRTAERLLERHCKVPAPLLARSYPGTTRGHVHRCARFTLVRNPEAFAQNRDHAVHHPRRERREQLSPDASPAPSGSGWAQFQQVAEGLRRRTPTPRTRERHRP
jgi:hypothetical protein